MGSRPYGTNSFTRKPSAVIGTSLGALSLTGVPSIKSVFERMLPGAVKVQTPYRYRCGDCMHLDACTLRCADDLALRWSMLIVGAVANLAAIAVLGQYGA